MFTTTNNPASTILLLYCAGGDARCLDSNTNNSCICSAHPIQLARWRIP